MHKIVQKIFIFLSIASLTVAGFPASAMATDGAYIAGYRWSDYIDEMLIGDFVEGEVVVGIDNSKKSLTLTRLFGGKELSDTGDEIATVSEDSLEISNSKSTDKDISIEIIRRDDMSTREILEALKGDSSVVFAEPNYLAETTEIEPAAAQIASTLTDADNRTGDQWGNMSGFGMHIPHWNEAGGNMDHEVIVVVMDSGIDNQHADLQNKIYHLPADVQAATGCSELRCDNVGTPDLHDHGTHVAGIIGAEWNDFGVSGVASDVKIIDVRNANTDGTVNAVSSIRGYAQIKKMMEMGIKIQAVNNSWSGAQASLAMKALVNEIGELGAVSLFAAGNDNQNIDTNLKWPTSAIYESPYVIVVGSSTKDGKRSDFSNYSDTIVDVYAPGSDIMSTVQTGSSQEPFDSLTESEYLNSFEDEASLANISVQQSLRDGSSVSITPVLSDKKVSDGSRSMALEFSPGSYAMSDTLYRYITSVKLGDLSQSITGNGSKMLGLYLSTDQNFAITTDFNRDSYAITVKTTSGEMSQAAALDCNEASSGSGIGYCNYNLPDDTDYTDFTAELILSSQVESDSTFYIDGLGIGNKTAMVSYKSMSGTSMATPGAVGALAVLLGNTADTPTADEAKTMLLSHVRKISLTEFPSKTGGIIDLSVNSAAYAPVITDTSVNGNQFILKGENFTTGSKVTLTYAGPYENASEIDVTANSLISSDQIIINFTNTAPKGLFYVTVTASTENGGQSTKRMLYAGETDKIYENTLTLVPDFEDSSDTASLNNNGLNGFAVEYDGYMYLMTGTSIGLATPMRYLYRYDFAADSWQKMASLPADVYAARGAEIDGKIVLLGTDLVSNKGYIYDISTDNWGELDTSQLDASGLTALSLVNFNGQLIITHTVSDAGTTSQMLYTYDYQNGALEYFATLNVPICDETAAVTDDGLYVLGYKDNSKTSLPILQLVKSDGTVETLTNAFDDLASDALFVQRAMVIATQFAMNLASVGNKLVLVGPANYTAGTDTFILENGRFVPYERRLSDSLMANVTAIGYEGRVYAMAFAPMEENRIAFRSSQIVEIEEPEEQTDSDIETSTTPKAPNSGDRGVGDLNGSNNAIIIMVVIFAAAAISGSLYGIRKMTKHKSV